MSQPEVETKEVFTTILSEGLHPTCAACSAEFEWGGELKTEAIEAAEAAFELGWSVDDFGVVECPACFEAREKANEV